MRPLLVVLLVSSLSACPFGGGPTTCTRAVETAMKSATSRAAPTDAGTLVTLEWPEPATPSELPLDYFQWAHLLPDATARSRRFTVVSRSLAEAEFLNEGGFAFSVSFPEPDRLGLGDCKGSHGGMADQVSLDVQVAVTGGGTRTVSTSAGVLLGAY